MSFTFNTIATRPNTSVQFYQETGLPVVTRITDAWRALNLHSTRSQVTSDDGLTLTSSATFETIENFSTFYNYIVDLNLAVEFTNYRAANPGIDNSRIATGFGNITIATTYNFPNGTESESQNIDRLRANDVAHLTDLQVLSDKVIATHTYADDADFSLAHFNDVGFAQNLLAANVTKTVSITAN
jgi:hypothetical protein